MKEFDYKSYRNSDKEKLRLNSILNLLPPNCSSVLEIGSRDCFFSLKLAAKYPKVIVLDLELPIVNHRNIIPMQGDVTKLEFPNNSIDFGLCTEVLEHIPPALLKDAASELSRVCSKYLLIGVPYKQDLRTQALHCSSCNTTNPTTGHLNSFDQAKLLELFPDFKVSAIEYVGFGQYKTNPLSYFIFKAFKFPNGSYNQEEPCVHCGKKLVKPNVSFIGKVMCFFAQVLCFFENKVFRNKMKHPLWIHLLLEKIEK